MRWCLNDHSMSFDLCEDFVFDKTLARALIEHQSSIRPLHEHFLLLGRAIMSLRDALKVPSFDVFYFDLEDQGEDEMPLMKQVAPSAQEIRPVVPQNTSEQVAIEATPSIPTPTKGAAGSSGSQAGKKSILDEVDNDPEVRSLDEALQYQPSVSLKSKGVVHEVEQPALVRKRKT
ncbi:hypothetical protein Hanom_Chr10g00939801 [Helianthus anomalus]